MNPHHNSSYRFNLQQIFNPKRIIDTYPQTSQSPTMPNHSLSYEKRHHIYHEHTQNDFFEDVMHSQIVQDYMVDEKQEPYPELHSCPKEAKISVKNRKMLDSSSEDQEIPSRKSSLSSNSSKQNFIHPLNKSFVEEKNLNFYHQINDNQLSTESIRYQHGTESIRYQHGTESAMFSEKNQSMDIEESSPMNQKVNFNEFSFNFNQKPTVGLANNHLKRIQTFKDNDHIKSASKKIQAQPHQSDWKSKPADKNIYRRDIDSNREQQERLDKIKKIQQIGCNCRKSKCLKMYCQCFNLQIFCNENCNCCGCGNVHQNLVHQKAVLDALTRNPRAFAEDSQKIDVVFDLGLELAQVKKGCKCKKTKCLKKYCECYNSKQPCGKFCQCEGCENHEH